MWVPLLLIGWMKLISGVHIEGWKWGPSKASPDVEWNSRATLWSVEFSPDGRFWTVIKDENGLPRVRDINAPLLRRFLLHAVVWIIAPPPTPSFPCCVASPSNGCLSILRFNDWPLAAPHTVYALRWKKRFSVCKMYCQQHNTMKSKYMVLKLFALIFTALAEVIYSMINIGKRFEVSLVSKNVVIAFGCKNLEICY